MRLTATRGARMTRFNILLATSFLIASLANTTFVSAAADPDGHPKEGGLLAVLHGSNPEASGWRRTHARRSTQSLH
jgi:hypothetical protein